MPNGPARLSRRPLTPLRLVTLRRLGSVTAAVAAALTLTLTGLTGLTSATAATRVSFGDSMPVWATRSADAGTTSGGTVVEGEMFLTMTNRSGAITMAQAESTPTASGYRHFKSPAQFQSWFSPSQSALEAGETYLQQNGMTVVAVPSSRLYIVFRGTVAAMNAAFQTKLHTYSYNGRRLVGPSSAPSIPAAIAGRVQGLSLGQSSLVSRPETATATATQAATAISPKASAATLSTPCSAYTNQHVVAVPKVYGVSAVGTSNCGYTPGQLISAAGMSAFPKAGYTGGGQTIAILGAYASPTIVADVNRWAAQVKVPALTTATYSQDVPATSQFVDQSLCDATGAQLEQTLDIEAAHGIAPAAKILYVGATDCEGGMDIALSKVLDGNRASIVSTSFGQLESSVSRDSLDNQENLEIQAALEGIGLYYASGDNGDEATSTTAPSTDFPASSPWVTGVGGTSVGVAANGSVKYVAGWGDTLDPISVSSTGKAVAYTQPLPGSTFAGGSGGGRSGVFAQAWYQSGTVPAALARGYRTVPDLSADADPYTGLLVGLSPLTSDTASTVGPYEYVVGGGTSLATPIVAAQIAIAQQNQKTRFGFLNPTLYAVHKAVPSIVTDVTTPTQPHAIAYTNPATGTSYLITMGADTSLKTAAGYDLVTGLGQLSFTGFPRLKAGK